jgi:hypothetical protein
MLSQRLPEFDLLRPLGQGRVGGLIVLVAIACFGSTAQAQHCGAYVSRPGDEALDLVLGLSIDPEESSGDREPSPSPIVPCDGPGCSKAPAAPGSSPVFVEPPSIEHWAVCGPTNPGRFASPHLLAESESLLHLAPLSNGIFHPPRHSAA